MFTTDEAAAPPDIKVYGAPAGVAAAALVPLIASVTTSAFRNNAGVDMADASIFFLG